MTNNSLQGISNSVKLLTTKDAAELLGVTVTRVQAMIKAERLPAEKMGRDYFIKEVDLKLVVDRKPGRPPKQVTINSKDSSELRTAAKTTQKLNETFRKVTEDEQQAGKKKGSKK